MKNIINSVFIDNPASLAAPSPLRLLFRPWPILALLDPKTVLRFPQSALLVPWRVVPGGPDPAKPVLSWGARSDLRMASSSRRGRTGVVAPSQSLRLDPDLVGKRRSANGGGGHSPDRRFPWGCSNATGP
jgi:hypothetical protein